MTIARRIGSRLLILAALCAALWTALNVQAFSGTANDPQHLRKPFLVIWQEGGEPSTDPKFDLPWGMVCAVWDDGWVIRPENKKLIGKAYIEGYASEEAFKKFRQLVASPGNLATPDMFSVAVDAPCRAITLWSGNKKHEWTRTIPDHEIIFNDIEARSWGLQLETSTPASSKDWDRKELRPF